MEDIRETGPVGLKGLKGVNREGDSIESRIAARKQALLSGSTPNRALSIYGSSPIEQVGLDLASKGYGDSIYDEDNINEASLHDLNEFRAEAQPWYSKVGAGLAKGVLLTGTTFLNGTVGLITGAINGFSNMADDDPNTGFWSGMWDNPFTQAMQAMNEKFEEELPNYYTKEEQNTPWYENIFTANFIGDKFIKNLGFSVGAIYSGGVWSKALRPLTLAIGAVTNSVNAPAIVESVVGSNLAAINEGSIEALNNSKDWFNYNKTVKTDEVEARLQSLGISYTKDNNGDLHIDASTPLGLKEKTAYEETLTKLAEDRVKMGNADLLQNIGILTLSNYIQFGKYLSGGYNTSRRALNIAKRAGEYVPNSTKHGLAWTITKGALSEGAEEMSQKAASEIAGNYYSKDVNNFYKAKTDRLGEQETLSVLNSISEGIAKTVGEGSSWEEFFIGALTGALGIPSFKSFKSADGSYQSPLSFVGGAYNHWKEYQDKTAREQEIADYLNNRVQSPEFLNYYRGLIRHYKYQRDMNQAAENGDELNFKNAEHSQLISDIIMFDNAGKLEDLITLIESVHDTSDGGLQAIVDSTTSTTKDGKKIGPFIDSNGNPMYSTPEGKQRMIDKLNGTKQEIRDTIDTYINIKNSIDISTKQTLSDEQLEELTWMKSQLTNWADRATEMSGEVKQVIGKVIGNLDSFIRFQSAVRTKEGMEHANLTDRYDRADRNVRDAERAVATLNAIRNLDDASLAVNLARNPDFVRGLMREITLLDDTVIEADEREDVLNKLEDIIKLGDASGIYSKKLNEYLSNPGQQVADHERANQEAAQSAQEETSASLRQKLDQATSIAQFRQILNGEQDATVRESVLQAMESEGNQMAKNYRETLQYNNELSKALNELGETDQVSQDAMTLWQEQFNATKDLEELANPNSFIINNEDVFIFSLRALGNDEDMVESRFQNARYALQRAMSKVNNDIRFKDRFSDEYKKPVDESVKGKGIDRDSTGDSGTSTVPHVNPNATPVETPSVPVGNVTAEMVASENRDTNRRVETQRSLDQSQQGQRRYYRPAVPELHIEASKEGDFRPFDVVVGEREKGVDFSGIYSYLRDNGAFNYVNAAKLKPGDTLGFMIDPEFNDHTIFLVDTRNNQIVGSIDESDASVARYEGLEEVIKKVRDEFSKRGEEATGKFFATPQTRVSKMMVGRIPYGTEDRSLADIPGVLDGETKPLFGIIKNGTLTTNEKIDDRLIIKPIDMAQKEGRLYLLIPNAAGTYSPAAVRVKHFNNQEFNLDDATVANTPIGRGINEALDRLADAASQDDVSIAMKELAQDLYMQDVVVTWFDAKAGSGIVISRKVKKPDGTYEMININGQEQIKESKYTIYYQNSKDKIIMGGMEVFRGALEEGIKNGLNSPEQLAAFGQPRDMAEIRRDILNTILGFNLPIQVSASKINDSGYNNRVIKSNVLTSNLREAKVIGSWFTTDYFDKQGNLQRSVSPSSVQPAPSRRTTTPVGGTEGVVQGTPVRIGNSTYTVDLKTMIYTDSKGAKYAATTSNTNIFAMAWAQENFGDSTESSVMTENKVITPQGRVLDRNTGQYVSDAEAKRIKDKIAGTNEAAQNKVAESKRVIADIYENQKRVDKTRTDSDYYYILEDDGQYHKYSRVHSRLGDNWIGERTETENSKRALEAGTAVDKVIRDFFTSKETPVKPEILSESAFVDIISKLTEIKSKMNQMGETFMADNIVLFQKYADGSRVAGEVDILSVDKNGNFKIYDVKTSKYTFSERHFTEKSPKQRMSTKDYYTLQLSAYQNLFESQYGVRPVRLAILPFVLSYDIDTVVSITGKKGILIEYNPAVNVPLVSAVQAPQQQEILPIFDSTMETMITKPEEQNRVLPENAFEEGGEIGYYEKDGTVYTGYLKKIGEVEVTTGSGQKYMEPIHVTKIRDRGFGRAGVFGSTSEYSVVFSNGYAVTVVKRSASDSEAFKLIMEALSAKPEKVLSLSNEKTQIHNPRELEELDYNIRSTQYSQPSTQLSSATTTIQREDAINSHDEEFEDDLDLGELRRVDDSAREIWNQEKELAWIKKVLPQLSEQDRIRVVKGLIQVAENGPVAWGMFSDGIITLSDIAAEGTTYHEAFHAIFNLMLDESEKSTLFDEARQMFGNKSLLELEEDMAEGFREYVASQETRGLGRKILDFFKNLFAKATNWKYVKPSLTSYYRMINQGKYKNYNLGQSPVSRLREGQYTSNTGGLSTTNDGIRYRTVPNSSWSAVDNEMRQSLEAEGWTQEKFDSISQKERDQAVECAGL